MACGECLCSSIIWQIKVNSYHISYAVFCTRQKHKFPDIISCTYPWKFHLSFESIYIGQNFPYTFLGLHLSWSSPGLVQESVQEIMPCMVVQEIQLFIQCCVHTYISIYSLSSQTHTKEKGSDCMHWSNLFSRTKKYSPIRWVWLARLNIYIHVIQSQWHEKLSYFCHIDAS